MKKEIRMIGVDDSPFERHDKHVLVVGAFYRGGQWLDGVMSCHVQKDGTDATEKIAQMINQSKFIAQLKCIFLDGIAVGGFNIIDILELERQTTLPVIVVMRKDPDIAGMEKALKKIGQEHKMEIIRKAGPIHQMGTLRVQFVGTTLENVKEYLAIACTRADIPEPLRTAHLIAAGIVKGQSRGRA